MLAPLALPGPPSRIGSWLWPAPEAACPPSSALSDTAETRLQMLLVASAARPLPTEMCHVAQGGPGFTIMRSTSQAASEAATHDADAAQPSSVSVSQVHVYHHDAIDCECSTGTIFRSLHTSLTQNLTRVSAPAGARQASVGFGHL